MSSRRQEKQDLSMLEASHFYLVRTIGTEVQARGGAGIQLCLPGSSNRGC